MALAERVRFLACPDARSFGPPAVAKPLMGWHTNRNPRGLPSNVRSEPKRRRIPHGRDAAGDKTRPLQCERPTASNKKPPNTEMT